MKKLLLLLPLLLLPLTLLAQVRTNNDFIDPPYSATSCVPGQSNAKYLSPAARVGTTTNGAWLCHYCLPRDLDAPIERFCYVSSVADISKWGTRIQTITKAADPLQSLRTAGTRFTIPSLTDPAYAAIVADMRAVAP